MTRRQMVMQWAAPNWILDFPEPFVEMDQLRPLIMEPGSVTVAYGRVRAMFEAGLADTPAAAGQ